MKVHVIIEYYFADSGERITPIKVFQYKADAEKFVEDHENEFHTSYDIYEFEVE